MVTLRKSENVGALFNNAAGRATVPGAVLRIRDILVRIRILGSPPLTNGSADPEPTPASAISVSEIQVGYPVLKKFLFLLFEVTLHNFSKIKSHKEVTKQYESKVFLTIFA